MEVALSEKDEHLKLTPAMVADRLYAFERTYGDHRKWWSDANLLNHAARHLMAAHRRAMEAEDEVTAISSALIDCELHRPALMLAAMSVELILKALIVKNSAAAENLQTHDLCLLSKRAGMGAVLDQEVLTKLTEFIVWKGRYPTNSPTKPRREELRKQKAHIEKVLNSANATLGDLRPKAGPNQPRALHDTFTELSDLGGTFALRLFDDAMKQYAAVFSEWQK